MPSIRASDEPVSPARRAGSRSMTGMVFNHTRLVFSHYLGTMEALSPAARWFFGSAIVLLVLYALVCVVMRLSYRRFVYPAPPAHRMPAVGAERLALRAAD